MKRRVLALLHTHTLPPVLVVYLRAGAATLSTSEMNTELATLLSKILK